MTSLSFQSMKSPRECAYRNAGLFNVYASQSLYIYTVSFKIRSGIHDFIYSRIAL